MPQMAPLYWLFLFLFFLSTLLVFFMMNYFIKPFEKKEHSLSKKDLKFKVWTL
uniref:ATP synthase complex subunit 8 n=1 Tax=Cranuca inversa TaxID=285639 RepID=A0A343S8R2_9EUCA|nr:ATP synthase F0 subunit 8 [Cranuca inversa]AUN45037.1 ATP synthase F0 subunit 8 [Cranuca inversa]